MSNEDTNMFGDDGLEITVQMDVNEIIPHGTGDVIGYKLLDKDGVVYSIKEGSNSVGRLRKANDIYLRDKFCSALHADILLEEGVLTLTDQGSTNGTFLNGIKLAPGAAQVIVPGDEIGLGHTLLRVEAVRDDEP